MPNLKPSEFRGYDALEADGCRVVALVRDGKPVDEIAAGDDAVVLLDGTPFYAESGGQVGDTGLLLDARGTRFEVADTLKLSGVFHGHVGKLAAGIKWADLLSIGSLFGMCFTVALLMSELSFGDQHTEHSIANLSVFIGSLVSALLAVTALQIRKRAYVAG